MNYNNNKNIIKYITIKKIIKEYINTYVFDKI